MYYTGVGSRETPPEIMDLMRAVAKKFASRGWVLRSGGAEGADTAFENGWWDNRLEQDACYTASDYECYVPWEGFNGHEISNHDGCNFVLDRMPPAIVQRARQHAVAIHPAWDKLKQGAQKLHTRNIFQVLGQDLDSPSKLLVCWAEVDDDCIPKGGTRTAWMMALKSGIPCFNLIFEEDRRRIQNWAYGGVGH